MVYYILYMEPSTQIKKPFQRRTLLAISSLGVCLLIGFGIGWYIRDVTAKNTDDTKTSQSNAPVKIYSSEVATDKDGFLSALEKFAASKNVSLQPSDLVGLPDDASLLRDAKTNILKSRLEKFRRQKKGTSVNVQFAGQFGEAKSTELIRFLNTEVKTALQNSGDADVNQLLVDNADKYGYSSYGTNYVKTDQNLATYDSSSDPYTDSLLVQSLEKLKNIGDISQAAQFGTNTFVTAKLTSLSDTGDFDTWNQLYTQNK